MRLFIHIIRVSRSFPGLLPVILCCFFALTPLQAQWTKPAYFDDSDMAEDLAEARTFEKYPTYDQYLQLMEGFAADFPGICRLDTIGLSTEGRLMLALKISDQVQEDEAEAAFLYSSTMHGNEIVGFVLLLRLADTLLTGYGTDSEITTLVDNLQIWINPLANPDGSYRNDNNLSLESAVRLNARGADLNRDFPAATRGEADDTTGRELETRNMMLFHRAKGFTMSANIHSGAEVVNYPWDDRKALHRDDEWYRFISREYADEAMAVDPGYMWGWPDNGITNGWAWYVALGTRQDYVNYYLGGREVTLELSDELLLPSTELEHHWNINRRSLINYMAQCMYGIRGTVSDLESGDPLQAQIMVLNHDTSYSVVHSSSVHGDFYRLIKEGSYDLLVSAPGYFNDTINSVPVTDYQATVLDIQLESYPVPVGQQEEPAFRVYPNPAVHRMVVDAVHMPHGQLELSIYSMDGRRMSHTVRPYNGSGIELSTSHLEAGSYLIRCTLGSHTEVLRLLVLKP